MTNEDPAVFSRGLIRAADRGVLATEMADGSGPYASLVMIALDLAAQPVLLISTLADHTRNAMADDRVSLLIDGTAGLEEPLTGPRLSLQGRLAKTEDPRLRDRYLRRHPSAEMYAGFGDFAFYRMSVARAHLVAGFGRIHWLDGEKVVDGPALELALADQEADVVEHMNDDHGDAVDLYATALLDAEGGGWRLTGVDPEGADLRRGGIVLRLPFDKRVDDAEAARVELVRLVKRARRRQADA
ncbi:MAG: DUF2470 domain-containing protein [Alphaproteobacteria bacterium]|nr:DUF2470 domain-containing protein [Alphaproteobacteria bacterium]